MESEIRKDFIVDRYVIIAPRRAQRPGVAHTKTAAPVACGFCPSTVDREKVLLTIGPKKRSWRIKVKKNLFPAVSLDNPKAYGVQEVVIETPRHDQRLDQLPVAHIEDLLLAYAKRTRALTKNKRLQYILTFKNSGDLAGASLVHSHSQIFATNFIPPQLLERSRAAQQYRMKHGRCAYCDMMQKEERSRRLIYRDRHVSVFSPYASQNNYEAWIMPRRHLDNITMLSPAERRSFARQLKRILMKIHGLNLPYNYYFHQVVYDEDQHLYIRIRPRGSVWAGVEIGSGVILNSVPPETAAEYFRS